MKTYLVRSYIAIDIKIEANSASKAIDLAGEKIHEAVWPMDYDYMDDARVYVDREEIDIDEEDNTEEETV